MEKKHIIVLNGPPGSGKDALADWIATFGGYQHLAFKDEMFRLIFEITGIESDEWFERYNDRTLKETPWDRINNMTMRQCMIHLSEKVVKPLLGNDYFGKVAAGKIEAGTNYVFSDGGFDHEIARLARDTMETHTVHIVRIIRPGYTFDGDSRNYVFESDIPGCGIKGFCLINYKDRLYQTAKFIMQIVLEGYTEGDK